MNVANIILGTGRTLRAVEDYERDASKNAFDKDVQNYQRRVMSSGVKKLDAEDSLQPAKTEADRLRLAADTAELQFQESQRPTKQKTAETKNTLEAAETNAKLAQQPTAVATAAAQGRAGLAEAEGKAARAGDEQVMLGEEQKAKMTDLQEKQIARMWRMLKSGDTAGVLAYINKSKLLNPDGSKITGLTRGTVEVRTKDGKTAREPVLRIEVDGGEPIIMPERALDQLETKHGTTLMEVGGELLSIDSTGKTTTVKGKHEIGVNSETGEYFDKYGPLPASSGVNKPGGAKATMTMKGQKHLDDRVKQGTAVVNRYFGISEFTGLNLTSQPKYIAIINNMAAKIRDGADPEPAANTAIAEIDRIEAMESVGGATKYNGPRPWAKP